jgi:hypothetical protein
MDLFNSRLFSKDGSQNGFEEQLTIFLDRDIFERDGGSRLRPCSKSHGDSLVAKPFNLDLSYL